jgi:SRSO17 transposase
MHVTDGAGEAYDPSSEYPAAVQQLLSSANRDADALRDQVRAYTVEALEDPRAALVLDDIQVLKKGSKSVGVAGQYCERTGDVRNCQDIVMLTYSSARGIAFIDRELFLPTEWTASPTRLREAGVPADRVFAAKPELAVAELQRAVEAGVPFSVVVADSRYGRDPGLRSWCHDRAVPYVVGVPANLRLVGPDGRAARPDRMHRRLRPESWEHRSPSSESAGVQSYDWARVDTHVADQQAAPGFDHSLLIRRPAAPVRDEGSSKSDEYAYFLVHAPVGTDLPAIEQWLDRRQAVEDARGQGKDAYGLDSYRVLKWDSWHQHVTRSMLARAAAAATRAQSPMDQDTKKPGSR